MTRYNLTEIAGELEPVEFDHVPGTGDAVFTAIGDPTQAVWDSLEGFSKLPEDATPTQAKEAVGRLLVAAFGDEQANVLLEKCGLITLAALSGTLAEHYTEKAGKVRGSNRASKRSTVRSKPTSNGSTASTSNGRSTAGTKSRSAART